jgi:hypothetical protein
MQLNNSAP